MHTPEQPCIHRFICFVSQSARACFVIRKLIPHITWYMFPNTPMCAFVCTYDCLCHSMEIYPHFLHHECFHTCLRALLCMCILCVSCTTNGFGDHWCLNTYRKITTQNDPSLLMSFRNTHTHTHMYISTYNNNISLPTFIHIIHTCIHTYTHTHTHTHKYSFSTATASLWSPANIHWHTYIHTYIHT